MGTKHARATADARIVSLVPSIKEIHNVLGQETPVELIEGGQVSWYGSRAIQGIQYLTEFASRISGSTTTALTEVLIDNALSIQ